VMQSYKMLDEPLLAIPPLAAPLWPNLRMS
jgi:hypothetical protein